MSKFTTCLFIALSTSIFATPVLHAQSIPSQPGNDIICTGPNFTYAHDVRQHGIDTNLTITGDAALIIETNNPYASYFTDNTKGINSAIYQYSFVAESGKLFGDVSVASRASIYENGQTVIGHYQIADGDWISFLFLDTTEDIKPIDTFENIHDSTFKVRYTLSWDSAYWANGVQLFRSWGPAPGQPGDYAFTFNASLISNPDAHKADLANNDLFINLDDFAVLASDFGITEPNLPGDIDGDGSCDINDLQSLAQWWLYDCYDE